MATVAIHMHADRKKYGLLKIPLKFSESLTLVPLNPELNLREWGHQPYWIISIQHCDLFGFFFPFPSAAQSRVHRAPGFILHTHTLFYASGLFVSLLSSAVSFFSSAAASPKQIQTHTETSLLLVFHSIPLGLQDSSSGIKGMKLCWPKRDFYKCIKIFPFREHSRKCRLKVNYSIFSLLSVLEAPKVFAGGHSECDHLPLER